MSEKTELEAKARKERRQRMIDILKSHGIEMSVNGCGCCGSPNVSFRYKGETIINEEDNCDFSTD